MTKPSTYVLDKYVDLITIGTESVQIHKEFHSIKVDGRSIETANIQTI